MQVDFWQLSRDPAAVVVERIARKSREQGQRLLIVAGQEDLLARISTALWEGQPEAFLAHGRAEEPHADRQPILLAGQCSAANGARHVVLADGVWRDEALGFDRAFLLFDDARLQEARTCWRGLGDHQRSFWRQDGGKWVKVA